MKPEHAEEYTQALGQIVAGGWRQIALGERLGVPRALGLTTRQWVEQRLGGYVRLSVEERHGAVKELKGEGLPNRKIAEVLGVDEKTVRNDAEKSAPRQLEAAQLSGFEVGDAEKSAPVDAMAALAIGETKDKQAKRREREDELRARRAEQEAAAREAIAAADAPFELIVADLRDWRPQGVDSIITDPPYIGDSIPLYEDLREFAVDVLPEGGPLVVMTWQAILPQVVAALNHPDLAYRWTICWRYANIENTADQKRRVFDCWKPVLVYHKGGMAPDAPMVRDEIANSAPDKGFHEWGQSVEGFGRLVRSFSHPGDVVCDPFLGGGTTAVAALAQTRRFIGCDISPEAVEIANERIGVAA